MGLEDRDYRADLRSLCEGWRELHAERTSAYMQNRDGREVAPVVYGLTAHVYYLAESVLLLDAQGRQTAAIPLVRMALECALTASWVELGGAAASRALVAEENRNKDLTFDSFRVMNFHLSADERERFDEELSEFGSYADRAGRNFYARCEEVAIGANMYALYRVASASSHAGTKITDKYIRTSDDGLSLNPQSREDDFDIWIALLVALVIMSDLALCRLGRREPRRTRLKELASVYNVPERATWTNKGFVAQQEREKAARKTRKQKSQA